MHTIKSKMQFYKASIILFYLITIFNILDRFLFLIFLSYLAILG